VVRAVCPHLSVRAWSVLGPMRDSSASSSPSPSAAIMSDTGHHGGATNTQSIADYLAQLLKDKKSVTAFPNVFLHLERLLDDEIGKVRGNLFQINGKKNEPLVLPDATGPAVNLSEKVYVPIKEYPEFNFVGRILGPRGMTTKQLEQETGCKIMVRGKGSMRDKKKVSKTYWWKYNTLPFYYFQCIQSLE
jgi:hypothetical protein